MHAVKIHLSVDVLITIGIVDFLIFRSDFRDLIKIRTEFKKKKGNKETSKEILSFHFFFFHRWVFSVALCENKSTEKHNFTFNA